MSLYRSASGREVNNASSSSLDTFRLCRRKFKLSRIDGWKQKDRKASLEFGKCLEAGLQFYFQNGLKPGDGADEFRRLWSKFIDQPLTYTDQEGDWANLNRVGVEGLRLFEVTLPNLPIKNPKFQLNYEKKLWPGDPVYGHLGYTAFIDILSTLDDATRLIIDVKTAKSSLDITPNMISLDGQLRKYAWVSGITEVGFLNFVKCKTEDFKKGTAVTLLEDCAYWKAGQQMEIAKYKAEEDSRLILVGTEETVQKMDEELDKISGKGATEKKEQVLQKFLADGLIGSVSRESITKVRLQFVRGTIPEEDLAEIGDQIGFDALAMHEANRRGLFPADGGIRFPNNACVFCEMNPICLDNKQRREDTLIQIKPKIEQEDDWLTELEEDGE
jgi:hypothetical protein